MDAFFGLTGLVGFIICLILLIIFLFLRKKKTVILVLMAVFFLSFVAGLMMPGTGHDGGAESQTAVSATPEPEVSWAFNNKEHPSKPEPSAKPTPTAEEEKENYIEACQEIDYKDLLRYPDEYVGAPITVTVKISQIMDQSLFSDDKYYFGRTDNDGYDWYLDDEYCLEDDRADDDTKILEDDVLKVYGDFLELGSFSRALTGADVEIPIVSIRYMEILPD